MGINPASYSRSWVVSIDTLCCRFFGLMFHKRESSGSLGYTYASSDYPEG